VTPSRQLACPDAVLRDFEGLCILVASDYFAPGLDQHDLQQEARIGLCKAHRDFNPEHGVSFERFARFCITRNVQTAVKSARRDKHASVSTAVSLDAPSPNGEGGGTLHDTIVGASVDPHRIVSAREALTRLVESVEMVPYCQREALALRLAGMRYEAISIETGRSAKTVDSYIYKARRQIRELALLEAA
jgi:RNA polymerase sigma-H factor